MIINSYCSLKLTHFYVIYFIRIFKNKESPKLFKGNQKFDKFINTAISFYSIVLHSFIVLNIGTPKEPYGPETCHNSKNPTTSAIKIRETIKVLARSFFTHEVTLRSKKRRKSW